MGTLDPKSEGSWWNVAEFEGKRGGLRQAHDIALPPDVISQGTRLGHKQGNFEKELVIGKQFVSFDVGVEGRAPCLWRFAAVCGRTLRPLWTPPIRSRVVLCQLWLSFSSWSLFFYFFWSLRGLGTTSWGCLGEASSMETRVSSIQHVAVCPGKKELECLLPSSCHWIETQADEALGNSTELEQVKLCPNFLPALVPSKLLLKVNPRWAPVSHDCNRSYSGGRDQEDCSSMPTWANSSRDPILKNPSQK
jgi:hypothetical protein